jgi:hypothetical protein
VEAQRHSSSKAGSDSGSDSQLEAHSTLRPRTRPVVRASSVFKNGAARRCFLVGTPQNRLGSRLFLCVAASRLI